MADPLNKQFALIGSTNETRIEERFPYMKSQRDTGKYGYACTAPGDQDRHGRGEYTDDIKKVIQLVILEGYKVRAKEDKALLPASIKAHDGSIGLGKTFRNYWVEPSLRYLVEDADIQPLDDLPSAGKQRPAPKGISQVTPDHRTISSEETQTETDADERYLD